MTQLKFQDPSNVAVVTTKKILKRTEWIGYVSHNIEDGAWQFLEFNMTNPDVDDAAVVGLGEIFEIDSTIADLADLPLGWNAWRETKESPWLRSKK